ncbi:MAG: NAD(P)H-dependent glycerol-3-phosphate dehydrogenase [Pyrinomonadaceae bacterium]
MKRVAIIGAGSWGTALGIVAAELGHNVKLWSRNPGIVAAINSNRLNSVYLPDAPVPSGVFATTEFGEALEQAELVIIATPSHATRAVLESMAVALTPEVVLVSATKGIEIESGKRISQLVDDVLGDEFAARFVCLSGPSFAKEVVQRHPTAIVAASTDAALSTAVQSAFSSASLRIYTNEDVAGTEIGGSVKNVMAIAAGMVSGLGLGSNSVAALITRGLAEMSRLAIAEGGRLETIMGLAGLGDLVLTCTGSLSRNRFVGQELGRGRSLTDITSGMKEVAEGINTTRALKLLANRVGVEMPITEEVFGVLYEGKKVRDAANDLMTRPLRDEF